MSLELRPRYSCRDNWREVAHSNLIVQCKHFGYGFRNRAYVSLSEPNGFIADAISNVKQESGYTSGASEEEESINTPRSSIEETTLPDGIASDEEIETQIVKALTPEKKTGFARLLQLLTDIFFALFPPCPLLMYQYP